MLNTDSHLWPNGVNEAIAAVELRRTEVLEAARHLAASDASLVVV